MYKCQGVTLIELLTVIAIMATLISLVPDFLGVIQRYQVTRTANQLIGATQFARTQAVSEGHSLFICLTKDNKSCTSSWANQAIIYRNQDDNKKFGDKDEAIRRLTFSPATKIRWRAFQNKSFLEMTPLGMTSYQNGTYTICHESHNIRIAKALTLNIAGRPYFARDKNSDGIVEYASGKDVNCD